jgi:oxygen-independent coproporphyrinogen-3 oxidase
VPQWGVSFPLHVPVTASTPRIEFDAALIRRFDRAGPRYTSYPTADRFDASFDEAAYRRAAAGRNADAVQRPLSLYVHLPFCRDVCFYCACNKIVTRDTRKASEYLEDLDIELALNAALFREGRRVTRMHWGGGTPTYYDVDRLRALFWKIGRRFELAHDGDYSIEVDPRTADGDTIEALRAVGFNRVSFGVQDFDPAVQAAVHRVQSAELTLSAIAAARCSGFDSINIDLMYGLPLQTPDGFARTLDQVVAARPGRVALYNYAHLPARFKPQRRIREEDLPTAATRLELLGLAVERLGAAGYLYIGMDHFALPDDALAIAQRQGCLRRDFQGYSTGTAGDLAGLGVSAIGAVGATYSQNHRGLKEYRESLDRGQLPIMRGLALSADDLLRRSVIHALMCNFTLSKTALEIAYLIDFDRYFEPELDALREFEGLGLLRFEGDWITVTPVGRFLIRGICMVFDRYLNAEVRASRSFSSVV